MAEPMKNTPVLAGKKTYLFKMSSSLKERLKKAGRSYTSPCVKKLKVGSPPETENSDPNKNDNARPYVPNDIQLDKDKILSCAETNMDSANFIEECPAKELPSTPGESDRNNSTACSHEIGQSSVIISTPVSSKYSSKSQKNCPTTASSSEGRETSSSSEEYKQLQQRIKLKEEKLRKLRLVKVHNSKNDLEKLEELTAKWKKASQSALEDLWQLTTTEPKPSLTQLVDHFSLHDLLDYNAEEETFS